MNSNPALAVRAKILAVLLRDARRTDGRSLKECAALIGVSPSVYKLYESGERSPSLPELELLAYYFDLPLRHFWGETAISEQTPGDSEFNADGLVSIRTRLIAAQLRKLRTEAGLGLKQLAEKAGLSSGRVSTFERGTKPIPLPELEAMAWALGVTVDVFLERQGPIGNWETMREAIERFTALPPDLREFVTQPVNQSYLRLAMRLATLDVERLRGIAEDLLDITY